MRDDSLSSRGPAATPHPHPSTDALEDEDSRTHPVANITWPSTIAGWTRIDTESYLVAYWKPSSSHVHGSYTRVAAFEQDKTVRITRTSINQFGGTLSKTTIGTVSTSSPGLVKSTIQTTLEQAPANGTVSEIPQLPSAPGNWELQTDATGSHVGTVRWEHTTADAALTIVQAAHPHTHSSRLPSTVRYEGELPRTDSESEDIVTGVPRTAALEVAMNTLTTLPAPLNSCHRLEKRSKVSMGSVTQHLVAFFSQG